MVQRLGLTSYNHLHRCWDPQGPQESSSWLISKVQSGACAVNTERPIIPSPMCCSTDVPTPGPSPDPRSTFRAKASGFLEVLISKAAKSKPAEEDTCIRIFASYISVGKTHCECSQPRVSGTEMFDLREDWSRVRQLLGQNFKAVSPSLLSSLSLCLQARES